MTQSPFWESLEEYINNWRYKMESKKFWKSKTLWVNLVAVIAIVLNSIYGIELDAETQAALATGVLAIINIILRMFTNQPIK